MGLATTFTRGTLTGTKIAVADGDIAHLAIVTARSNKRPVLALVDLTGPGVQRRTAHSLDPSRSLATLTFDRAPAQVLGRVGDGATLLQTLLDRAAVLYAFEQLGGAQRAFELTREFCLGRYAFGRSDRILPGAQAPPRRLLRARSSSRAPTLLRRVGALDGHAQELGCGRLGARVPRRRDAFELASTEMIQMHGGVGFTWEYDCHLFYRRAKRLAAVLGRASAWREKLIRRLEKHKG